VETYSRIGILRSYGNLQSYWNTTKLWKLTVVLDYCDAMETYSRIGLVRSYGNLQSYWTTAKLWKLTVVLNYIKAMETYSRIELHQSYGTYSRIGLLRSHGTYSRIGLLFSGQRILTERDLEEMHGGPGVYSVDLNKKYDLARPEWKYDSVPEVMDGHNIADFIDPDIEEKLKKYGSIFSTRFECTPHLPHSFRVYFSHLLHSFRV